MRGGVAAVSARRTRARESFQTAAECIGRVEPGMALFALTRGQFSMLDAIQHCLAEVGPAFVSVWTWTIADYEVQVFTDMLTHQGMTGGRLVIDYGARNKNRALIERWVERFGAGSVRMVVNHAKIATITNQHYRLLLRGSMNLNFNPRFEQLDITEGGADYELISEVEEGLEVLSLDCSGEDAGRVSRVNEAFEPEKLALFGHLRRWAK